MKQSLFDAETVALDAKREAAFLRSANLELKKQMVSNVLKVCNKAIKIISTFL